MSLPYLPRLLCLALACFLLLYGAAALVMALAAPWAVRWAKARPAPGAANLLFVLRLLPAGLAATVTLLVCVPGYVWFESETFSESVGLVCLSLAAACGALCVFLAVRAGHSLACSVWFARRCRQSGSETNLPGSHPPVLVIETLQPCLALIGILYPRIIVSQGVLRALTGQELSVVLSHESAHQTAFDNLKRLCLLVLPGSKSLERSWIAFAEYAADQRAVVGDPARSVALASALVKIARLGATPQPALATPFLADASDLAVRVDRLLVDAPSPGSAAKVSWYVFGVALAAIPIVFRPATFRFVHALLERLVH